MLLVTISLWNGLVEYSTDTRIDRHIADVLHSYEEINSPDEKTIINNSESISLLADHSIQVKNSFIIHVCASHLTLGGYSLNYFIRNAKRFD
ncbi:unnamed protein product [Heterobilharzia americana]|nr:unnamed protein product [Heterobilharzia americana]